MTRVLSLLLLICLCATVALAEIPCVSPDDAVLVLNSPQSGILTSSGEQVGPSSGSPSPPLVIVCPPGKRVGLWIASPEPVLLGPMLITDCEVGVVVGQNTRWQTVEGFMIRRAKVGVCWQADEGGMAETHIEATEAGIVVSGKDVRFSNSSLYIDSLHGIGIKVEEDEACTCQGAV